MLSTRIIERSSPQNYYEQDMFESLTCHSFEEVKIYFCIQRQCQHSPSGLYYHLLPLALIFRWMKMLIMFFFFWWGVENDRGEGESKDGKEEGDRQRGFID